MMKDTGASSAAPKAKIGIYRGAGVQGCRDGLRGIGLFFGLLTESSVSQFDSFHCY